MVQFCDLDSIRHCIFMATMACPAWPLDPQWLALPRLCYKNVTDAIIEEHCNEMDIGSYVVQVRGGGGFSVPWYLTRGGVKLPTSVKLKGVVYGPVHAKETADGFVSILVPPPQGLQGNQHAEDALPSLIWINVGKYSWADKFGGFLSCVALAETFIASWKAKGWQDKLVLDGAEMYVNDMFLHARVQPTACGVECVSR